MALQSLDIVRRSATTTSPPNVREPPAGGKVAKLIDTTKCIGCKACQVACMEWNDLRDEIGTNVGAYQNPHDLTDQSWTLMRFAEYENPDKGGDLEWLIRKDGCEHCADPGCLKACPAPGAIVQYANGIVDFDQDYCIGCQYCVTGCPFNIPKFNAESKKVYKCTLCSDRVSVGLEPACIKACPTGCLQFGSKEDMKAVAEKRAAQLREHTSYKNAGVYDPPGVGGTHVMYVLHDIDNPEAYGGLPKDPRVPWLVRLWKGPLKWLGNVAMAAGVIGMAAHYLRFGPKAIDKEEEAGK
jgi:formate dehydrogenase iron-sulfur subunit